LDSSSIDAAIDNLMLGDLPAGQLDLQQGFVHAITVLKPPQRAQMRPKVGALPTPHRFAGGVASSV
jgi:hypothetical protein